MRVTKNPKTLAGETWGETMRKDISAKDYSIVSPKFTLAAAWFARIVSMVA